MVQMVASGNAPTRQRGRVPRVVRPAHTGVRTQGVGAPWWDTELPTTIAGGPALWWRADSLDLADTAHVAKWEDSSGNGIDMVALSGSEPKFTLDAFKGLPAVLFPGGSGNRMDAHHAATIDPDTSVVTPLLETEEITVFAVMAKQAGDGVKPLNSAFAKSPPAGVGAQETLWGLDYSTESSMETIRSYWFTNSGGNPKRAVLTHETERKDWRSVTARSSGATSELVSIYAEGELAQATDGGSTLAEALGHWRVELGAFNGYIGEILIYASALSDANREAVEEYLEEKWRVKERGTEHPTGDTYISNSDNPDYRNENYGDVGVIRARKFKDGNNNDSGERAFLKWDLSGISASATVSSATLRLNVTTVTATGGDPTITIERLASAFDEMTTTHNTQPTYAQITPTPSQTVDETGWWEWDVTELVQGWVDGTWTNHGLAVIGPSGTVTGSGKGIRFHSRETTLSPELVIVLA